MAAQRETCHRCDAASNISSHAKETHTMLGLQVKIYDASKRYRSSLRYAWRRAVYSRELLLVDCPPINSSLVLSLAQLDALLNGMRAVFCSHLIGGPGGRVLATTRENTEDSPTI
eukprot:scaffold120274_cov33-Tisochrysis_lutea.AAC.3